MEQELEKINKIFSKIDILGNEDWYGKIEIEIRKGEVHFITPARKYLAKELI